MNIYGLKRLASLLALLATLSPIACRTPGEASKVENIDNADPASMPRDQKHLGVCVSFGFSGQLENNLYNKYGVTVDLSERYFLRSALIEKGELYNVTMDRFDVFAKYGAVPEEIYPYQDLLSRKHLEDSNTQIESWQGYEGFDPNVSMENTLAEIAAITDKTKRKKYLEQDSHFSELKFPDPGHPKSPVQIPVVAVAIRDPNIVPEFEGVPCFKGEYNTAARSKWITPYQFAKSCLKFDIEDYSEAPLGENGYFAPGEIEKLEQKLNRGLVASVGTYVRGHRTALFSIEPQRGFAEHIDLMDPAEYREPPTYGHAILVTGYLSRFDLTDRMSHKKGFLKDTSFEELELLYDLNLTGIHERIYGDMFPFNDDLNARSKALSIKLLDDRVKLQEKIWELGRKLKKARTAMELNQDWSELASYKKLLKEQHSLVEQRRAVESELFDVRRAGLEFMRSTFAKLVAAYKKFGDDPREYPFTVRRNGENLAAYLKGFTIPIKEIKVPESETLRERMARRMKTDLGKMILKEGGLLFIRNSWGPAADPSVRGYNYMTYEYFLKYSDEMIW